MLIAKVQGETIGEIGHWSRWFSAQPSFNKLSQMGFKRVNDIMFHDPNTQKLVSTPPYIEGDCVVTVRVESLTDAEIATQKGTTMSNIRNERNVKLAETDWHVLKKLESGSAIGTAMITYRQALRDIPATIGDNDPRTWDSWPTLDE